MDPSETLNRMLQAAKAVVQSVENTSDDQPEVVLQALDLAEAVLELHLWMSRGGFLPRQWARKPS